MTPAALRLRLLLAVAPALHACGASSAETGQGATPPTTATGQPAPGQPSSPGPLVAPPPGAQAWVTGGLVCTTSDHTRTMFGPPAAAPFASCQDWPDDRFVSQQIGALPCGPCSFAFVPEATRQMRSHRPEACCYRPGSPPDPGEVMVGRPLVIASRGRRAVLVAGAPGWAT